MKNENSIDILSNLIKCKSITPSDDGCQNYISNYLENLGFNIEIKEYDNVTNMIARYGNQKPVLAFVGHTDVVATGKLDKWSSDPFVLTEIDNRLYGRGTSDMKGSIACMLQSINNFLSSNKDFTGSIMMILTSDEEGPAQDGIKRLVNNGDLKKHNIDMCLVGEPSCKKILGDTIKNGRRGSLSGRLTVKGIQGHIAYPHNAKNPIHDFSPVLKSLVDEVYDSGNDYFPPTSFQVSNLNSGIGSSNVIPGDLTMDFNFRYSTETNKDLLQDTVVKLLNTNSLDYDLEWHHSGEPYLTTKKELLNACKNAVMNQTNQEMEPNISTDGGTSDGRFMAKICNQVIEFGLINESIHKINEHTTKNDMNKLSDIYENILRDIF